MQHCVVTDYATNGGSKARDEILEGEAWDRTRAALTSAAESGGPRGREATIRLVTRPWASGIAN